MNYRELVEHLLGSNMPEGLFVKGVENGVEVCLNMPLNGSCSLLHLWQTEREYWGRCGKWMLQSIYTVSP